ncbi:MAG: hypothetical protein LAP21_11520 [Acidobacteriia bacterium]|nr:hypothetical protein [Terriglobia bacterium]
MKRKQSHLKPAFGAAREERFPRALNPEHVPIDERKAEDWMAFAFEFSRLLNYYDETNKPVDNWSAFFERDPAFLLARVVTTDFQREQFDSWKLYNGVRSGRDNTREILKSIRDQVSRMDRWYRLAGNIEQKEMREIPLRETLASIIETDVKPHLGANLETCLKSLPQAAGSESWLGLWRRWEAHLDKKVWHDPTPQDRSLPSGSTPSSATSSPDQANPVDSLLAILRALHHTNGRLREVARQYLQELLANRSDHAPHTALYLAFVRLMELMRDKINTVTGKHLDFYYRDVLRLSERPSRPDIAHICCEAAPEIKGYMLPAGTRLAAGKDPSGAPREYATDEAVFINRARVESLKALYVRHDRFKTSSAGPKRIVSLLALQRADSEDGLAEPLHDPEDGWPTFGLNENAEGRIDRLPLHADLGFVLASPVLLLQEGERNVVISIAFTGEDSLDTALRRYKDLADEILDIPPSIDLLLADAFLVSLSSEKGWMPISRPSFRRHPVVGTTMEIEFTLESTVPAVVANPGLAPDPRNGPWPMLKVMLNPFARVFPYLFFKELTIETIDLRVRVSGLQKMLLRNEVGLLNAAQPFPVFGPVPAQGSYLLLSHPELAAKRVDHVAVTTAWFNLPKPPESLASHYAAYNLGINDESFKVRLSVFGADQWIPAAGGQDLFPLFARDFDRSTGLLPVSAFSLTIPEIPPPPAEIPPIDPEGLTEARSPRGSIRFELAEPVYGFGHAVFPRIVTDAATANARAGKKNALKALPNPPLAPVARSLRLDYDAADKLVLSHPLPEDQPARFYSIHPFGFAEHQGRATPMLAEFEEQGHLYIGLAESGPQQALTLLFQLRDSGFSPVPSLLSHTDEAEPRVRWRYLAGNQWKDLPDALRLSDTTMGLTHSGIIKFSLPEDISTSHTIMPGDLCWLEAAAPQVADVYWSNVVSINTQAVTATRICNTLSDLVPAVLPAGTITQLTEKLPQIKTVMQPFATGDGRSRESTSGFPTRVSERLRHKDRAIQTFDYERLVLDQFPEVGQVKCIGYNNSLHFPGTAPVNPGMLYLVVAPRLEECTDAEPRLPQFVLKRIADYLRKHASSWVKDIHVINPVYETLKVFANVEFNGAGDASYFSDDLDAAISRYLQPWKTKPGKPLFIGSGQVQGYQLALFIQQQSYVKRLQKMAMLHTFRREKTGYASEWRKAEQRAWASAPWAVLVPEARHGITAIGSQETTIDEGIRNLTVGDNLVMGEAAEEKKEKGPEQRYFLVVPRHAVHRNARP